MPVASRKQLKPLTRQEFLEAMYTTMKMLIRFKNPLFLVKQVANFIAERLGLSSVNVLLYDKKRDSFILIESGGSEKIPGNLIRLASDNMLIRFFSDRKLYPSIVRDYISSDAISSMLSNEELLQEQKGLANMLTEIREEMRVLKKAKYCVPSYARKNLVGILLMGPKVSGQKLTKEEIDFLIASSEEVALAFEKAQLIHDKTRALNDLEKSYDQLEKTFEKLERAHKELGDYQKRLEAAYNDLVQVASNIMTVKDQYTGDHLRDSVELGLAVGKDLKEKLGWDIDMWALKKGSQMHDIGKAKIASKIIQKKGRLTKLEFEQIKTHPRIGAQILEPVKSFRKVAEIVLQHHERPDGTGYPKGTKNLLKEAAIVTVVDSYLAMTTQRPYNKIKTPAEAVEETLRWSGKQFLEEIVESLIRVLLRKKKLTIKQLEKARRQAKEPA